MIARMPRSPTAHQRSAKTSLKASQRAGSNANRPVFPDLVAMIASCGRPIIRPLVVLDQRLLRTNSIGTLLSGLSDAEKNPECEVPDGEDNEDGDQRGEHDDDDVLELVVKAEQAKAPLRLSKLLFDAHDRSSPLAVTVVNRCGPGPGAP